MRYEWKVWVGVALIAGFAGVAPAATVTNINSTITNTGSTSAANYQVSVQGSGTIIENVPPAASFGFVDAFNQVSNVSTSADFGSAAGAGGPWNFQDNILFSTNGASVQAQAIAQLTGVSNLQVRVISLSNPAAPGTLFDVTSNADAANLIGNSSVTTIINGWTNFVVPALGVDYTATLAQPIGPGNYILQIRGEASAGSSYSGTISFTPVPLPAALPLFVCGLGLFGRSVRRSERAA